MTRYALHVGLYDYDTTDPKETRALLENFREQVREAVSDDNLHALRWVTGFHDIEVHADGDSFREWGEPFHGSPYLIDSPHGIVVFSVDRSDDAWNIAMGIFRHLITGGPEDWPVVNLGATCVSDSRLFVPMALSRADDWSIKVPVGGVYNETTGIIVG